MARALEKDAGWRGPGQGAASDRPGHDKEGTITFAIFDNDKREVALGEIDGKNMDEGEDSYLFGTLKLKNRDFDRVFARGRKPIMRVTLRVEQ